MDLIPKPPHGHSCPLQGNDGGAYALTPPMRLQGIPDPLQGISIEISPQYKMLKNRLKI